MKKLLWAGLMGFLALSGTAPAARFGLFVGLNEYNTAYVPADNWLSWCVADAGSMRTNLIARGGGWATSNTTLLVNSAGAKTAIRAALSNYAAKAVSGDVAVYYHSSHGGNDDLSQANVYLCSYNADYTEDELAADLLAFAAGVKMIVVVDACHSGGLFVETARRAENEARRAAAREWNLAARVSQKMAERRAAGLAAGSKEISKRLAPGEVGWMTACAYYEYSYESADIGHGWFTHRLLQGFDYGDSSGDGQASFQELFDYAYLRIPYVDQVPQDLNAAILATLAGNAGAAPAGDAWDYADNVPEGATELAPAADDQTHGAHAVRKDLDESDFFAIPVMKNRCYTLRSTNLSGDVDAYLYTYSDADGLRLVRTAYDVNYPADLNFSMVYKPVESGTVYLRVQPYFDGTATGAYSLVYANAGAADSMATLSNGVAVSIASLEQDYSRDFRIPLPAGQTNLTVRLSGGTGDSDLYIARGYIPGPDYDYTSQNAGNNETNLVADPAAGDWFIKVNAYETSANLTLRATYAPGGATVGATSNTATNATFTLDLTNGARVSVYAATNCLASGHWNWTLRSNAATVVNGKVVVNLNTNAPGQVLAVGRPLDF